MPPHVALVVFLTALLLAPGCAIAQTGSAPKPAAAAKAAPPAAPTRPAWSALTPAQREALAPLAGMWPTLESDSKEK